MARLKRGNSVWAEKIRGTQDEAEVCQIIKRGFSEIVGIFRRDKRAGYLIPDDKRYFTEIYVPLSDCFKIKNGDFLVEALLETSNKLYDSLQDLFIINSSTTARTNKLNIGGMPRE